MDPACSSLLPEADPAAIALSPLDLRRYAWIETRQRLHQGDFRDVVINGLRLQVYGLPVGAYAVPRCGAHHSRQRSRGIPIVYNGLSLRKIHHAAYDTEILGISALLRSHISRRVLEERDGPMLRHGLQELDGTRIILSARP